MKKKFALLLMLISIFSPLLVLAEDAPVDPEEVHAYFANISLNNLLNAQRLIGIELEYRGYSSNETSPISPSEIRLSEMNYSELVALKDQIDLVIWNSDEWQEVKVPQGVWKIGEDIPEGHWTITAVPTAWVAVTYGSELNDNQKEIKWGSKGYYKERLTGESHFFSSEDDLRSIDIDAKSGYYIEIEDGSVIFSPYSGKPSFSFK